MNGEHFSGKAASDRHKSKSNKFHSRLLFSHARKTDKINKFIEDYFEVSNIIIAFLAVHRYCFATESAHPC